MAVKKSELYRSLWSSCDELRGGMDAGFGREAVFPLYSLRTSSDTVREWECSPESPCRLLPWLTSA
jgi:type I restriction enzyme M protein